MNRAFFPGTNDFFTIDSFFFSQVDDTLRNLYSYLQRLAVGLEQVVLDQTLYDGHFMEEFHDAEFKLKAVSMTCFYYANEIVIFSLLQYRNLFS